jgi:serralysin
VSLGAGNDQITLYSGGTDNIDGGTGNDHLTLLWNSATDGVWLLSTTVNANGGYDGQFNGLGAADTNFTGIEQITFIDKSGGDDIIRTGAGKDTLKGGGGDDELDGGAGRDTLSGGNGVDVLRGGDGKDKLNGGSGSDTLNGGLGNDSLRGGSGADTFQFGSGLDRIRDFNGDFLALDDALWGGAVLTNAQILGYANVVNGTDTVFDFGGGNTLTLENYIDIAALDAVLTVF